MIRFLGRLHVSSLRLPGFELIRRAQVGYSQNLAEINLYTGRLEFFGQLGMPIPGQRRV